MDDKSKTIELSKVFDQDSLYLQGPDGHYITPDFWTDMVQPGWTVEVYLDDSIWWKGKTSCKQPMSSNDETPTVLAASSFAEPSTDVSSVSTILPATDLPIVPSTPSVVDTSAAALTDAHPQLSSHSSASRGSNVRTGMHREVAQHIADQEPSGLSAANPARSKSERFRSFLSEIVAR